MPFASHISIFTKRKNKEGDNKRIRDRWLCFCLWQDPREYFDSQQGNALRALGGTEFGTNILDSSLSKEEAYRYLKEQISEVKSRGLKNPVIGPDTALKVRWYIIKVNIYGYLLGSFYNLNLQLLSH